MFRDGEMEHYMSQMEEIEVPKAVDDFIWAGIRKESERRKRMKRVSVTLITAALIFISVIGLLSNETVSKYVTDSPVFGIVNGLFGKEKGPKGKWGIYIQELGEGIGNDGMMFTVEKLEGDRFKGIIHFSVTGDSRVSSLQLEDLSFKFEGEEESEISTTTNYNLDETGKNLFGRAVLYWGDNIPEKMKVEAVISWKQRDGEFRRSTPGITVEIDREFLEYKGIDYTMNHRVDIEGQRIWIRNVTVYPTTVILHIQYDERNTKKIFGFDNITLYDDGGKEYSLQAPVIGVTLNEYEELIYFDNEHLSRPKEFILKFAGIYALNPDQLEVQVDLKDGKLLKRPDDRMTIEEISTEGDVLRIGFKVNISDLQQDPNFPLHFERMYFDDQGNRYEDFLSMATTTSDGFLIEWLEIPLKNLTDSNTVSFVIQDYPAIIPMDTTIHIKR